MADLFLGLILLLIMVRVVGWLVGIIVRPDPERPVAWKKGARRG